MGYCHNYASHLDYNRPLPPLFLSLGAGAAAVSIEIQYLNPGFRCDGTVGIEGGGK